MKRFDCKEKVTVIVAVYNHFHWLRLILDALRSQSVKGFEVVIADDGSDKTTVAQIKDYQSKYPELQIIHSWQPDEGWRKNKCLNKAVRAASGDFLIFIDGDCVPHPRFVEDHLRIRRRGLVFGGRRVEMTKGVSDYVEAWEELPKDYFRLLRNKILAETFQTAPGMTFHQLSRTIRFPFINGSPIMMRDDFFWGCNFSIHREDLESVNGFDERYIDPGTGEDIDLGVRLRNAGISLIKNSHYALMFHRHHQRLDFSSPRNAELFETAQKERVTFVEEGLNGMDGKPTNE